MGRKGWIILLTFITVLVVGGSLYKVHEKKVEEKNEIVQIKMEHKFVVDLKKKIADIKSIKFNFARYNSWINAYDMRATLTYENSALYEGFFYYRVKQHTIDGLEDNRDYDNIHRGVTKGKVEVTYTNGKKTSI
ncbi:hypothetical protein [Dellaglioa algida]|uniref:hypothetical protein n=1 Tax=Dellaglioa algida TaxID=105612 RepID=UPI0024C4DFC2|nr:hypothetical protein [Dellaglioa algida]MDK1726919.1 hypothetical protein [Dellaglioa algida]